MKVFVTGSSGLIGKWVLERILEMGWTVRGFDRRENPYPHLAPHCEVGDIMDEPRLTAALQAFEPDAVIHLAARCDLDGRTLEDYDSNIGGVENLCRAVKATPSIKRALYTSSQLVCKVGYIPTSYEDYCPHTVYGESKVGTERTVRKMDGGGCTWCLLRPTTVWGPYMNEHYQSLLRHLARGNYFHSGGGALHKSYAYAGNIAYQYIKFLEAPAEAIQGKAFYLADYEPLSLRAYIDGLAAAFGVRQPVTVPLPLAKLLALAGDAIEACGRRTPYNSFRLRNIRTEYVFDMTPTEQICGPLPFTFEEGVQATAQWFMQENPGLFKR